MTSAKARTDLGVLKIQPHGIKYFICIFFMLLDTRRGMRLSNAFYFANKPRRLFFFNYEIIHPFIKRQKKINRTNKNK